MRLGEVRMRMVLFSFKKLIKGNNYLIVLLFVEFVKISQIVSVVVNYLLLFEL